MKNRIAIILSLILAFTLVGPLDSMAASTADSPAKCLITNIYQSKTGSNITVTWKKAETGIKGYEVYRKPAGGTYAKVKTIKDRTVTRYKTGKLLVGRTYYFKVRAYKISKSGKKVYGKFSDSKSLKVTKINPALKSPSVKITRDEEGYNVICRFTSNDNNAEIKVYPGNVAGILRRTSDNLYEIPSPEWQYALTKDTPAEWKTTTAAYVKVKPGQKLWVKYFVPDDAADITDKNGEPLAAEAFFDGFNFLKEGRIYCGLKYKTKTYSLQYAGTGTKVEVKAELQ